MDDLPASPVPQPPQYIWNLDVLCDSWNKGKRAARKGYLVKLNLMLDDIEYIAIVISDARIYLMKQKLEAIQQSQNIEVLQSLTSVVVLMTVSPLKREPPPPRIPHFY